MRDPDSASYSDRPRSLSARLVGLASGLLARRGIRLNAVALTYGTLSRVFLQLVSVPVFTYFWGLADYGTWLLLFTVPTFLGMGDLGFNTAASNAIITQLEKGNRQEASEIFGATRRLVLILAMTIFVFAAGVLLVWPQLVRWVSVDGSPAVPTVLAVVSYGLIALQTVTTVAGFRSTGRFAEATFFVESTALVETGIALSVVALGGSLFDVALAYLGTRAIGSFSAAMLLRRHAPILFAVRRRPMAEVTRELSEPALAVMALPISNAVSLQGAVAVIGAVAGPAVVPIFTTTRTLSRLPVQLTLIPVHAAGPSITSAWARDDRGRLDHLVGSVLTFSAPLIVLMLTILALGGQWLIGFWTHDKIVVSGSLLGLMLASSLIYTFWLIFSNFILATNRQSIYSYVFLFGSLVTLGLTALLVKLIGIEGAALAALLLDLTMLGWLIRCNIKLDMFGLHTIRNLVNGQAMARWRRLLD